jgi:tungstate transport system substrate-binding protein
MADGYGERREPVMHNDFVLVGPRDDPADVRGQSSIAAALQAIQDSGSLFLSRGDDSGTHVKELTLWAAADVDPSGQPRYQEAGQGMGATLIITSQKAAYALTDRATYLATRDELELEILSAGDERLVNPYHVITVRSQGSVATNQAGADAFADFIVSRAAQTIIAGFGVKRFGQPLFFADACKDCD